MARPDAGVPSDRIMAMMRWVRRLWTSVRNVDLGALLLEIVVLVVGVLLALAVDRWNQARLDDIETGLIVERLKSDTARNLTLFDEQLSGMEQRLSDAKALFRALRNGNLQGEDPARIEAAIAYIDVVPSYPLLFAGYEELVATGRLRQLEDPVLIDLLGLQRAEYEASQAVIGYWRDIVEETSRALDQHVDFDYTTADMDEAGMGVRFDLPSMATDRKLRNGVFHAVDVHGDWLRAQTSLEAVTRQIDARLRIGKR